MAFKKQHGVRRECWVRFREEIENETLEMADSCCSFASLSESPELCLIFLIGISVSCLVIYVCGVTNSVTSVVPEFREASDNGCTSQNCVRCDPIRKGGVSNALKRWKHFGAGYIHGTANLKRVDEAMTEYAAVQSGRQTCCKGRRQRPTVLFFPGLTSRPCWNRFSHVPLSLDADLSLLEENFRIVKAEFNRIDKLVPQKNSPSGWIVNEQGWRMYHLVNQGVLCFENLRHCPRTSALFQQLKYAMAGCVFGFASFSVIEPGTEIRTHCGPTNARLRCHLGLNVPPECKLIVDEQNFCWTEGECLLFDDSYPHSVIHRGNCNRTVLLIDFWHPDLKHEERAALGFAFSSSDILHTIPSSLG